MATQRTGAAPRAMIHKRILDSAISDLEASLERLAADVAGASPDLVERVLEEYGDPGEPPTAAETNSGDPMPEQADITNVAELTEKQRETLRAIDDRPDATQAEHAEALGRGGRRARTDNFGHNLYPGCFPVSGRVVPWTISSSS